MQSGHGDREFLGQGLAFPLQINPRGEIALASGERDIEQSIRIILGTRPGERKMRPEFGCRAQELIFEPHNAATEGLLREYVEAALGVGSLALRCATWRCLPFRTAARPCWPRSTIAPKPLTTSAASFIPFS